MNCGFSLHEFGPQGPLATSLQCPLEKPWQRLNLSVMSFSLLFGVDAGGGRFAGAAVPLGAFHGASGLTLGVLVG